VTTLLAWVDGHLIPADQATVSAYDRGFRGGEGVFETLRAYGDHPFRLQAHAKRAVAGAAELGFTLELDTLVQAVSTTASANLAALDGEDSVVRLTASAGPLDPDSPFPGAPVGRPTVVVTSHRLVLEPQLQAHGGTVATVALARELPHVKAVSYLVALTARRRARERGADEALLTTDDGRVLEAAAANVFAVVDGGLLTPPTREGLLAGVTRSVVLEVAATRGIPVEERPLLLDELLRADEAFLTATTREVVPLVGIDDQQVGDGTPGPVTKILQVAYREEVARERGEAAEGGGTGGADVTRSGGG
jgi:branched-chain amino acid aminotransferase